MSSKLAIDFGTTNSVVARWNEIEKIAEVMHVPGLSAPGQDGNPPLIPSLLYVQDGRTGQSVLGQAVLDERLHHHRDNRFFSNFKRGMLTQPHPEPRLIDGVPWGDQEVGQRFLHSLLNAIPDAADQIEQLVVTAPVEAFDGYLAWLSKGMQVLTSNAIRVVDESTAAALGYAVTEPSAVVLVFDFGGGSLDISLVQLPESREKTGGLLNALLGKSTRQHTARVIAKGGLTLGGSDVDQWLLAEVLQRNGLKAQVVGKDYAALLMSCEQAKIALSDSDSAMIQFEIDQRTYSMQLQRTDLEELLHANGFFATIQRTLDKVMHTAQRQGIFSEDIHHVLLVGGSSLMPSVQNTLKAHFHDHAVRTDKPFTAVVEGALQIAVGFGLDDYLAHGYGLRHLDIKTGQHRYDEIIPMGSRYPTAKPVTVLLSAAHAGQTEIELVIGEINTEAMTMVEVRYEEGQAVFVAQADPQSQYIVPLNAAGPRLARLDSPGAPGIERLRVQFSVDAQRQLRVSAFDLKTKKEILSDEVIVTLSEGQVTGVSEISKREPQLLSSQITPGQHRLSLRGLGTLLNILPPEAVSLEALAAALHSDQFYVRFCAAEMLGRRGDRDARQIMQEVLEHGSAPQRSSVARHLYRLSWYTAEPLLRQAFGDPDRRVRESTVYGLCLLRTPEAHQLLLEALSQDDEGMRSAAAWGLGRGPDAACVPALEMVLQARDPETRVKALESLGASQATSAIPVVQRSLEDPDLDVKYAAGLSWIELSGETCLAELASLIENSSGLVRLRLIHALFHATNYLFIDIGRSTASEAVLDALQAALCDPQPEVRITAAMPLAWMHHERATAILLDAYTREQDGKTRAHLVYNTASLMAPAGEIMLKNALTSSDEEVQRVAQYLVNRRKLAA